MHSTGAELAEQAMQTVPSISCDEYKAMEAAGTEHILLDVREPAEWEEGHIPNALKMPRGLIEFKMEKEVPEKNAMLIICCAKGGRAALAGETLMKMGYTNLKYLEGGYEGYCA